jgi:hypothetical protein
MKLSYTRYALGATIVAAVLFLAACPPPPLSSGDTNGAATVTLSGAVTGTFSGTVVSVWTSTSNGSVAINFPDPSPLAAFDLDLTQPGQPTVSTWTETDAGAQSAILVQEKGTVPPSWVTVVGGTSPNQGTYTLNLTSVAILTDTVNDKAYTVHGTLNATLPAQSGSGATGTVNLSASF